ncbi:glycosyltransferase family 25 protein [Treponema sp. OMZ 792]|uniref:glycosyltransferase family 25 protein n=1 Tax=unclassified Treponema TaxID=2638727 RepID=UPI0020A2BC8C|nr:MULTISPECIES: glycosyltransferase family 25 protein [unclassified Treponema]UTC76287.1 glycosyltransferase family 25 protein [Treponema sp. OMZ 792]UTC80288.1 glycosyltransferase family 25 protein [Treponema sp. OMZ 798]
MRVFIVNLKESTDRRQHMIEEMKKTNLQYEFFDAVNGKDIKNIEEVYDKESAIKEYGRELKLGEIGCAMSHLLIFKKMIEEDIEQALIFEDDIIISNDFNKVFSEILKLDNNGIILLGQSDKKLKTKIYFQNIAQHYKLKKIFNSGYGTYGYIICKKTAEKIYTQSFPIIRPIDQWGKWWKIINISVVIPNVINCQDEIASIIDKTENRARNFRNESYCLLYVFFRKTYSLFKIIFWCFRDFFYIFLP